MDILGKLFSSNALVRIMRLFILNPNIAFENKDIISKSKVSASALRVEISILDGIRFIKKKSFYKEIPTKPKKVKSKKKVAVVLKPKKKRVIGWQLNSDFQYLQPLRSLLVGSVSIERSYKDKEDNWKTTNSFNVNDLPKLILASEKAYEAIVIKEESDKE